jgi:N-acyl-D-aspartate/D-glutamate deacylase
MVRSGKVLAAASVLAGAPGLVSGCATIRLFEPENTILLRNGTVYDGTLAEPVQADILIHGDRIVEIGNLADVKAARTIDASGLAITPGFIDIHTHSDLPFKKIGMGRLAAYAMPSWKGNYCYLYQGVTTIVTGNCGYGYTDTAYWLDMVDSLAFGSNVYHLAPHGEMRCELFSSNQPGQLTGRQMEAMERRLAEELEKGAVGFSSGLEYAPGLLTPPDELVELNKIVRKYGRIYTTHVRDLTGRTSPSGRPAVEVTLDEAFDTARQADVPVQISHLMIKAPLNNAKADRLLEMIDKARKSGLAVTADQFPYSAGQTLLSSRLPVDFKDVEGVREEFRTKKGRDLICKAIEERFAYNGPENIRIAMCPEHPSYEGRTLSEIAGTEGRSPAETYAELVCEKRSPMAIFSDQDERNVIEIMSKDSIITASDGFTIPHGKFRMHPAAYGTFPRKFRQSVLERKEMSASAAIRTMTSLPAEAFNLKQRGKIAKGYYADLAVIDLKRFRDNATFTDPHLYAEGVVHLFVNGVQAMENQKPTGRRGGRGLRMT